MAAAVQLNLKQFQLKKMLKNTTLMSLLQIIIWKSEYVELRASDELENFWIGGMELDKLELFSGASDCIHSHKVRLEKGMAIACNLLPKYKYLKVDGLLLIMSFV